jgi:TolB protein
MCFLSVAVVAGMASLVESGSRDVRIDVTRPDFEKIPIGLLGFHAAAPLYRSADQVADIIRADLSRSLLFNVVDTAKFGIKLNGDLERNIGQLKPLTDNGISVILWGNMVNRDADLVMEGYVFDGSEEVFGKRYSGNTSALRMMAHRLADELVNRYTGEPGIARTKIAYVSQKGKTRELYVMDYDGFAARQISSDGFLNLMPRWSPDRRSLVYASYRGDRTKQELHMVELETGRREILISHPSLNMTPAISPDGTRLAFSSSREGNTEIHLFDPKTKALSQLTVHPAGDLSPSWSPTGQEIVFTSDRSGRPQLYIMNADGSNVRRLTYEGDYNAAPAWSPRGNWIAHVCRSEASHFKLCLTSPDGQKRKQLTSGSGLDDSPSWSPDGRHLVFSSLIDGKSHIYMINSDGTGLERLTSGHTHDSDPAWSPA